MPDLVAGPAGVRPASLVERAVVIQDVDELQVVALAGCKILGVMRRRDLQFSVCWSCLRISSMKSGGQQHQSSTSAQQHKVA